MSGVWFRHAANFGEHPKTLRLRRLAGRHGDSAECGWWRLLEAAKRYGSWSFDDEDHVEAAAGRYARFIPLYRAVGFLDGLTIHNGEEYQAPLTGAERVARHRARNEPPVTPTVTPVTPREKEQKERAEQTRDDPDDDRPDLEAYLLITRRAPTAKQRQLLDEIAMRRDETGAQWAADLMLRHPDDPIGSVIEADKQWRAMRIQQAQEQERPTPKPRRPRGLPESTKEILDHWAAQAKESA